MKRLSKNYLKQTYIRLLNHKGTPESIGRGAAIGLLIGFVIPFSLQMAIAFPLALLCKAAKFPALLFTWISNPVSIPFLYPLQCFIGSYLIGHPFSYESIKASSTSIIETPTPSHFFELGREVVLSFFAGGALLGGIAALLGYFMTVRMVRNHRIKKAIRKERKRKQAKKPKDIAHETC